jgi:lipopolysaccharide transport protein LptA
VLQIDSGTAKATEVHGGWGELLRSQGELALADGVQVKRGGDRISSERLRLSFSPESQIVQRALFLGGATLLTTGERPFGTSTFVPGGPGERKLECLRLDLAFSEEGSLQSAVAAPEASLEMRAQGVNGPEVRRAQGQPLGFHFDEQGRLKEVHGLYESLLEIEALPPSPARRETLRCKRFLAYLEPETGGLRHVDFFRDVSYTDGTRQASADRASYHPAGVGLTLENQAHLTDEREGVDLSAGVIYIQAASGDVQAQGDVRSLQQNLRAFPMLASSETPTIVLCSKFQYTARDRTAHYEGGVVLRSGTDEIRAESIRLQRPAEGGGRMEATGSVEARLQPAAREGEEPPPLVEASAESLVYDGAARRLAFEKDVTIHQGIIEIESPATATLTLDSTGRGIEKLVAGKPVEVTAGPRKAKGDTATFTPADQAFVIVGDEVSLDDPELRLEGRAIQFRVGHDEVLVDGEERARTEMILVSRPAPDPPPKP